MDTKRNNNLPFVTSEELEDIKRQFSSYGTGKLDLKLDSETGIALLAIDHYEHRNSFCGAMIVQFDQVLDQLEAWKEGKAVIIYGKGGFFSSGADLDTVRQIGFESDAGRSMNLIMQHNLNRFQCLPLVTVAVIEGKAIGGGAELSTACDFRLIGKNSEIGFVQIKMGITTGFGGGARLVKLLGHSKALELLVSGRRLSAQECLKLKLVDEIIDSTSHQDTINESIEWINKIISSAAPEPIQASKKIVTAASTMTFYEALEEEMKIFTSIWGKSSHKAAMKANVKHK